MRKNNAMPSQVKKGNAQAGDCQIKRLQCIESDFIDKTSLVESASEGKTFLKVG